ncbi:MAG: hypothetical protein AAF184_21390 [Pseudomonadota bacterium]
MTIRQRVCSFSSTLRIVAIVGCLVWSVVTHATMQIDDALTYKGKKLDIRELPLEQLYSRSFLESALRIPEARCSASWRGYQAFWAIRAKKLLLTKLLVDPCLADSARAVPARALRLGQPYPIHAVWYTGVLNVHAGWDAEPQRIQIRDGVVITDVPVADP